MLSDLSPLTPLIYLTSLKMLAVIPLSFFVCEARQCEVILLLVRLRTLNILDCSEQLVEVYLLCEYDYFSQLVGVSICHPVVFRGDENLALE